MRSKEEIIQEIEDTQHNKEVLEETFFELLVDIRDGIHEIERRLRK